MATVVKIVNAVPSGANVICDVEAVNRVDGKDKVVSEWKATWDSALTEDAILQQASEQYLEQIAQSKRVDAAIELSLLLPGLEIIAVPDVKEDITL